MHDNQIRELVNRINAAPVEPIPEKFSTVDKMIENAFDFAKDQMIGSDEDGDESQMLPTWVLLTQNGQTIIMATPFDNGAMGKDMVAEVVKKLMTEAHVIRYTFASEAWVATQTTPPSSHDLAPSERNDRREVLMITGADRKNGERIRIWNIVRDKDGVVTDLTFEKEMEGLSAGSEGRFTGLLEQARH
jgi:hypothetical protein